tara:strand:+ start:6775 stop:7191 length:417 start_codon:yes stop_codon:yes gene_type:complete
MKPAREPIHRQHGRLQTRRNNPHQPLTTFQRDFARCVRRALDIRRSNGLRSPVAIGALPVFKPRQDGRKLPAQLDRASDNPKRDFAEGVVDAEEDARERVGGIATGGGMLRHSSRLGQLSTFVLGGNGHVQLEFSWIE